MAIRLRYPEIAPDGYAALSAFGHYVNTATTLSPVLIGLVYLRASLLNNCGFCINLHSAELRKQNEPQTRITEVAEWNTSGAFTPRERAALAWTDTLTQLQTGSHASDADYAAVREFFDEKDVVDLTFAIAAINAWNRLGIAFRPSWNAERAKSLSHPASALVEENQNPTTTPGERSAVDDDGGKVAEDA